jgi:hypothetical protein
MMKKSRISIFLISTIIVSQLFSLVLAGTTVVDTLSFGTVAVLDNASASEITVSLTNQVSGTNYIRILIPGHRAEFLLTSYPTHTTVFTTVNVLVAETSSPATESAQFTLVNLETAPSVTTDGTGFATVYVGGTLQTSGSGSGQYFDSTYTATYELDLNF